VGHLIYVAGGARTESVGEASFYDVRDDRWTALPPLAEPRDHLSGAVVGETFYAVGGRRQGQLRGNVDAFINGAWQPRAPMMTPRAGCGAGVIDGRVFVVGGEGNGASPVGMFDENEAYDPSTDSWTSEERMETPRHGMGAAVVGRTLYVPGGGTLQGLDPSSVHDAFTP
jgi:N-acetylneuraminic acid mutarotase